MVFGVSGFQSQAITYPNDNVACEHIHKKQLKALSFFNQHIHPSLFLLGMLIFGAKELSLRQTASPLYCCLSWVFTYDKHAFIVQYLAFKKKPLYIKVCQ